MKQIRVGIDPAFRKTGFAVCILDTDNSAYFKIFKNSMLDFLWWFLNDRPENALWIVENSNLQDYMWPDKKDENDTSKIKKREKSGMDVGKNQAASQFTVDLIKSLKCEVIDISPLQKGKAWSETQFMQQVNFRKIKILNYSGREDERVALQCACKNVKTKQLINKNSGR